MAARRTIAKAVTLEGAGLHEGRTARLRLVPALAGTGIRFARTDLAGAAPVPVDVAVSSSEMRRTQLSIPGGSEVHTIEHLMAAVSARGITDLLCEIDQIEVPGMDGSARLFDAALLEAGLRDLAGEAPRLVLDRPVVVEKGDARIVAVPSPGRLTVGYQLDYANIPGLERPLRQRAEIHVTAEGFAQDLAPARTFAFEAEALALREMGFGKGATTQNTLIIRADGTPLENTLRFENEYARHKALDLLGDLMLLGVRLEAHVMAYKAGHGLNADLVRALREIMNSQLSPVAVGLRPTAQAPSLVGVGQRPTPTVTAATTFMPPPEAVDGHFPGDPVVPGVVMLAALRDGRDLAAVEGVKFRRVVRPGEALSLERPAPGTSSGKARASVAGEVVVDAVLVERSQENR